jgi:hypothetical protein
MIFFLLNYAKEEKEREEGLCYFFSEFLPFFNENISSYFLQRKRQRVNNQSRTNIFSFKKLNKKNVGLILSDN